MMANVVEGRTTIGAVPSSPSSTSALRSTTEDEAMRLIVGYRDKRSAVVYAVLTESGEVRFFTSDALRDPSEVSPEIRRSGALK